MNNNKLWLLSLICLSFILVISLILNVLYPLYADDWAYSFIFETSNRIQSVTDVFYSQYIHYFNWGGRSIAHFIAQNLLLINNYVSDFFNALVYTLLIYTIYLISNKTYKLHNYSLILVISSLLVLFIPVFIDTTIWKTGSSNYLWTTLIILLFLRPFVFNIYKSGTQKVNLIIIFIGGIIAGWTNENTGFGLIIASIIFIISYKIKYNNIPLWSILGTIGVLIGFSLMILSPGNFVRAESISAHLENQSLINRLILRVYITAKYYIITVLPLTSIYLLIYMIYKQSKSSINSKSIFISIVFLIMAHVSTLVMIFSPNFPIRATFGSVVFLVISVSILFSITISYNPNFKNISFLIIIGLVMSSSLKYITIFKEVETVNQAVKIRNTKIDSFIQKNVYNISIQGDSLRLDTSKLDDLSSDSTFWLNQAYAKYNNISTITLLRN